MSSSPTSKRMTTQGDTMYITPTTQDQHERLAIDRWQLDPSLSTLAFRARTFWGLQTVGGHFDQFAGHLEVDELGLRSMRLTIDADSLATGNGAATSTCAPPTSSTATVDARLGRPRARWGPGASLPLSAPTCAGLSSRVAALHDLLNLGRDPDGARTDPRHRDAALPGCVRAVGGRRVRVPALQPSPLKLAPPRRRI